MKNTTKQLIISVNVACIFKAMNSFNNATTEIERQFWFGVIHGYRHANTTLCWLMK